jgi:hypothetical protein
MKKRSYSELRDYRFKKLSLTIGFQIVFSQNPKLEDRTLKNGENIGHKTDGSMDRQDE